jgi:antitoxin VapB
MALSIKNSEVDRLARELSDITGETITEAIAQALKERLERETGQPIGNQFREEIERIQNRVQRLSRLDDRSDEEILGYDKHGLPT